MKTFLTVAGFCMFAVIASFSVWMMVCHIDHQTPILTDAELEARDQ